MGLYRNLRTGEEVEAVQLPLDGTFDAASAQMIAKAGGIILPRAGGGVNVQHPGGMMVALPGDWIVRVAGVEYLGYSRWRFGAVFVEIVPAAADQDYVATEEGPGLRG